MDAGSALFSRLTATKKVGNADLGELIFRIRWQGVLIAIGLH
jgi:hypothetical protein